MTTTVKLKFPVSIGGTTYTELTLRRPKARDLLAAEAIAGKGEIALTIMLVSLLAEVDEAVIGELDASDYFKVNRVTEGFTEEADGEA